MIWYLRVLKKSFVFSGRARRKEFWYFMLFNILVSILVVEFVDFKYQVTLYPFFRILRFYLRIFGLLTFLPMLALSVRRLHDINIRGWWVLLGFLPIVYVMSLRGLSVSVDFIAQLSPVVAISLLDIVSGWGVSIKFILQLSPVVAISVIAFIKGNQGENRFGPDPKTIHYKK